MSSPKVTIPQRRSLLLFTGLAMFMVLFSYVFTVCLAAACVFLPLLAVYAVPNFQTLALCVGGIVVACIMLWSLVPRRDKFEAPGLLLDARSHPLLFTEIESIAAALNEPLPREVYLIGDSNAWVADRGGLMGMGSRRILGIGLPLLAALNISQFRAVLAHEFAHYYGGDTRLGPLLHRTQMSMIRTFRGIGSVGEYELPAVIAILCIVVFGILKWYWLLFLQAINLVARRQEYRADELACLIGGPAALTSGLRVVHGTSLAWPPYWQTEIVPMLQQGCLPLVADGFSQFLAVPIIAGQVQAKIEEEIREGKVDRYDSHPPLRDRLAAADALGIQSQIVDPTLAVTLLNDAAAEELRFLEAVNPDLQKNSLRRVSWEEQASKVLIPSWTESVTEYASLLQGATIGNLPHALKNASQLAPQIRDPKGMLLTPEQRVERARFLLATAFGLALANNGWILHSRPAEFYLSRGEEHLNPHKIVQDLCDGSVSADAWAARCRELAIEGIPLAITTKPNLMESQPV